MSQTANILDLGPRTAWWLRACYYGSRAKTIARDFDVSEATAKRWLAGERPTSEHLAVMATRWGARFVAFVFEPVMGTPAMFVAMDERDNAGQGMRRDREAEDARVAMEALGSDATGARMASRDAGPLAPDAAPEAVERRVAGSARR